MDRRSSLGFRDLARVSAGVILFALCLFTASLTAHSQTTSLIVATPAEGTTAHIWTVAIINTLRKQKPAKGYQGGSRAVFPAVSTQSGAIVRFSRLV